MRKIRMAVLVVVIIFIARRYARGATRRQRRGWCETSVMPDHESQDSPFEWLWEKWANEDRLLGIEQWASPIDD